MQKLITLFSVLLLTAGTATAQADRVVLRLRLSDRGPIAVGVDGRLYDKGTSALTLDNLRPGPHRVTVYAAAAYGRRPPVRIYTGTLRFEPGTTNIAVVDVDRRSLRLRTYPAEPEHADGVFNDRPKDEWAEDNRGGRYDDGGRGSYDDVYGRSNAPRGNDDTYSDRSDDREGNSGSGEGYGSFPHGRDGSGYNNNRGSAYNGSTVLSQRDMDALQSRVKGRITDTDKEQLLKNVLQNRTATTEQIRSMLSWLSFDSTKLDFAKWAYSHAADPRNYWKLEDAFSFSSSKEEFSKSVSGR